MEYQLATEIATTNKKKRFLPSFHAAPKISFLVLVLSLAVGCGSGDSDGDSGNIVDIPANDDFVIIPSLETTTDPIPELDPEPNPNPIPEADIIPGLNPIPEPEPIQEPDQTPELNPIQEPEPIPEPNPEPNLIPEPNPVPETDLLPEQDPMPEPDPDLMSQQTPLSQLFGRTIFSHSFTDSEVSLIFDATFGPEDLSDDEIDDIRLSDTVVSAFRESPDSDFVLSQSEQMDCDFIEVAEQFFCVVFYENGDSSNFVFNLLVDNESSGNFSFCTADQSTAECVEELLNSADGTVFVIVLEEEGLASRVGVKQPVVRRFRNHYAFSERVRRTQGNSECR